MRHVFSLFFFLFPASLMAQVGSTFNASLVANVDERNSGSRSYNDIWAYEDTTGREYAVMGAKNGTIIYDLSDPASPQEVAFVPGTSSIWRDIKSFGNYLYVVADRGQDGLLIINMENAQDTVTWEFWKPTLTAGLDTRVLEKCHNLYIDEQGICFIAGCNLNSGGVLMFDVASTPGDPQYIGPATFRYSHDVFARGDTLYSADLTNGFFSLTDVSNKQSPDLLAFQQTTRNFTHNVWPSDDSQYLFTTDERPGANVDAYDISDLDNIQLLDTYRPLATEGQGVVPHNVFFYNDYLVISYYADGVKIVDASRPDNLIEVGAYDTSPNTGSGDGCWGVYPYLSSGLVLASDMDKGLFVLDVDYQRACYLEGRVIDAETGTPLSDINVVIPSEQANFDRTRPDGTFRTGILESGTFEVEFKKAGYEAKTLTVDLQNGLVTELEVALEPIRNISLSGVVKAEDTREVLPARVVLTGTEGSFSFSAVANGDSFLASGIPAGTYDVYVGLWGYQPKAFLNVDLSSSQELSVFLSPGYEDDFSIDQDWKTERKGNSGATSAWTREVPVGTVFNGQFSNPAEDAQPDTEDPSGRCYITGNGLESPEAMDVDGGTVTLQSPPLDLRDYENPEISFYYWFFNAGGSSPPDDDLRFYLVNTTDTVLLTTITDNSGDWQRLQFAIADYISPDEPLWFIVEAADVGNPHLVEAGLDAFEVLGNLTVNTEQVFEEEGRIEAFPNPFTTDLNLRFSLPQNREQSTLRLFNQWGQQLQRISLSSTQDDLRLGQALPAGIYYLVLETPEKRPITQKVIKQ
ncbi:MAG TPA: choice-of-anchor B family protein [Saprospiraceae bacterium]|nr:choice-of-anchor B family protein [Saprospiraceae bacterium]